MPLAMLILRRRAALASNCSTCVKDGVRKRRARISLGVKCADEADAAAASFILLSRAPAVSMRKHSRRLVDWHTGRTAAGQRNGTALAPLLENATASAFTPLATLEVFSC
jgi:hypothetical protein